MSIASWLIETMKKLGEAGVDSPRRDALVLLEDILKKERSWVLAHSDYELTNDELGAVNSLIERRINREPLAYIRGKAWFYGRFFKVTPQLLIPRPESEAFIELLKDIQPSQVIDIGTGSGCLAITAKLELPETTVIATDIDENALDIAKQNAKNYKVSIDFHKGSLLEPIPTSNFKLPTSVITNLPYVPNNLITSPEIEAEPKLALFSGSDGLDHYRSFWEQVNKLKNKPEYVLTESLETQHNDLEKLAAKADYTLSKTETLVQLFIKR